MLGTNTLGEIGLGEIKVQASAPTPPASASRPTLFHANMGRMMNR